MKPYFAGLDDIRTYAFLTVFVSHVYFGFFTVTEWGTRWFAHGEVGVYMFFVLSAFLITYLSLSEYAKTGTFSILHFFKKRILRIWPVYFFVLLVSYVWYVVSNTTDALGCLTQFIYFFGNVCMIEGLPNMAGSSTVAPLWSVSVEQQFYVAFPLALIGSIYSIKHMRRDMMRWVIHTVLCIVFMYALYVRYVYADSWNYISYAVATSLPAFISGMYLAYWVYKKYRIVEHVRHHPYVYTVSAVLSFFSFLYVKFEGALGVSLYVVPIIYTTGVWIILATKEVQKKQSIETSVYTNIVQHLGKISYGLYAYHMFAIVLVQYIFERTQPVFSSGIALCMTILVAHVSYRYIESWFLKFK